MCTKHIQCKHHFVCNDLVAKGEAVIHYIPTDNMVADILTKPLIHDKHLKFTKAMGLQLHSSGSDKTRLHHTPSCLIMLNHAFVLLYVH
ncbi:hypothetical protein BDR04DRAFT_435779 [Suillus decipiens]|nr:hypothetical protein BDR04DRAFT_435779 [Suillus decipiens]